MSKSHGSIKRDVDQLCEYIHEHYLEKTFVGVLLCEGDDRSIDVLLYKKVYPYLLVVPAGGFADIKKVLPCVKNRVSMSVYGLIDRDGMSKKELVDLQNLKKIYCTKLPFIENIICTPEMLKIACKNLGIDYKNVLKKVRENAMSNLSRKLKDTLPVNVSVSKDDIVESIRIIIVRDDGCVLEKIVSEENVLYTYRDKTIASYASEALGLHGRQDYYSFIASLLEDALYETDVINVARSYLPMIDG